MKKLVSILLAAALAFCLCACSSGGSQNSDIPKDTSTPPGSSASDAGTAEFEARTITISVQDKTSDVKYKLIETFSEYVTEATNGQITFNIKAGGTVADATEELEFVGSGALDMCNLQHNLYTEILPLRYIPSYVPGTTEEVQAYLDYILFENEETSKLIEEEAASWNVKLLNAYVGGSCIIYSRDPINSFAELCDGRKVGVMDTTVYLQQGITAVTSTPDANYENISRGVIDAGEFALDGAYSMKYYEVAPYFCYEGLKACGGSFTINLDLWNSLSAELQQIFLDAAKEATAVCNKYLDESEASWQAEMEAAGTTFTTFSEEDIANWGNVQIRSNLDNQMAVAEKQGITEQMTIMHNAICTYFGLE